MKRKRQTRTGTSKYRSGFERVVAAYLKRAGVAFSYESFKIPYTKPATYTPDFVLPNGVILEVKGYWTGADRTKHKLVREAHPDLDIRFVFQNAHNRLNKNSNTSYAEWCDKYNFKWCHQRIPGEWMK